MCSYQSWVCICRVKWDLLSHKQPEKKSANKKHNDECLKIGFYEARDSLVPMPESEISVEEIK